MASKNKIEKKSLRRSHRAVIKEIVIPRDVSVPEVKVALRLEKLPLIKLHRRLKQACRRASTCKFLLNELSHDSLYTSAIRAEQIHQIFLAKQVQAEIKHRTKI